MDKNKKLDEDNEMPNKFNIFNSEFAKEINLFFNRLGKFAIEASGAAFVVGEKVRLELAEMTKIITEPIGNMSLWDKMSSIHYVGIDDTVNVKAHDSLKLYKSSGLKHFYRIGRIRIASELIDNTYYEDLYQMMGSMSIDNYEPGITEKEFVFLRDVDELLKSGKIFESGYIEVLMSNYIEQEDYYLSEISYTVIILLAKAYLDFKRSE